MGRAFLLWLVGLCAAAPILTPALLHVAAVSLTLSIASWLLRKWRERFDKRLTTIRHLKERLKTAGTYAEWRELAGQLESVSPGDETARAKLYDARLLAQKLQHLRSVRQNGNVREMMFGLRSDLIRNVANVAKRYGLGGRAGHRACLCSTAAHAGCRRLQCM